MVIVAGRNPAVFISEKEMIVSFVDQKFKKIPLSQITDVNGLGPVLKTVVSRSLGRLTELGISFSISVNMEQDAEDEDWSYALVKIGIESRDIDVIRNELLKYAYKGIDPFDATKVLLVLENV